MDREASKPVILALAASTTTVQSGMVMDVSAMLVATTTLVRPRGAGPKTCRPTVSVARKPWGDEEL